MTFRDDRASKRSRRSSKIPPCCSRCQTRRERRTSHGAHPGLLLRTGSTHFQPRAGYLHFARPTLVPDEDLMEDNNEGNEAVRAIQGTVDAMQQQVRQASQSIQELRELVARLANKKQ